jgi:hypothetical protein
LLAESFMFKDSGEVVARFCQIPDLCQKAVCPDFCFSRMVEFPTAITHKSSTVSSHIMDH